MNKIVEIKFGSQLYGTNSESSDTDIKGIFLPSKEEVLLGRIPKSINTTTKKGDSKNSSDDVDTEMYSLHYFIKLACEGQTVALDMLHAPNEMCDINRQVSYKLVESKFLDKRIAGKQHKIELPSLSNIWLDLQANRSRFYTKNLDAFVGYCRRQASKYSCRGSRLDTVDKVIKILKENT